MHPSHSHQCCDDSPIYRFLDFNSLIMQRAEFENWHTWDGDELDDNGDNIAFCDGGF